MSSGPEEAFNQSVAASCALLIAFHGVMHEMIGPLLFPWAPATFGFAVWHGMGFAVLIIGALMFAATLRVARFPVLPAALFLAILATAVIAYIEITHGQFHFFALSLGLSSATCAVFYRRAEQLRNRPVG